ncbi:MAG: hypothetical protein ThorAB25_18430 [Candidatus Thorarchaeota archaeon AB_25]|nr:MAG: hypothetical protein ThorAB25_18430 [Candidatus Thorarchaeota archaeon AB_25]
MSFVIELLSDISPTTFRVHPRGTKCQRIHLAKPLPSVNGSTFSKGKAMALDQVRTTQMQLGQAGASRHVTAFSPPGIAVEAAKYPVLMAGVLASTEPSEYLSIFDHPESWMGLDKEAIMSMRRRLYRFTVPIDARAMEPSNFVEALQTIALSVSPVAIEVETANLPPRDLYPLRGQLPASSTVEISSLEIMSEPEISRVAKRITELDIPASEAAWKLLDYDYSLDQVARLMSVGLLGRLDSRRLVPTRGAYKAVIDAYISRCFMELTDKSVSSSYRIGISEIHGENFTVFAQPGKPRVDYFKIERTQRGFNRDVSLEGVKNVTIDSKTSIFADHARFSAYADLVKQKESAQVSIFHYARNNNNSVLGPWLVRAGVCAAFESDQVNLDTKENALTVLDSLLSPDISVWTKEESILDSFGGSLRTVENSSLLSRL